MFRSEFHLLFIVLFSENILRISSEEASVPFLSWSNKDSLDGVDDFPAGHRVDRSTLSSQVIDKLYDSSEPQLIVLFYFNKLSIDDISKYSNSYTPNSDGGVLHNLKSSIEDSVSHLYLPMVSPVQPSAFASKAAHIIDFQEHSKDWTNLLQRSDIDLLQVYLKANENQVESSLREADGIISNVMKQVNELGLHYTSILTARASSKVPDFHKQEDTIVQVGRHLLADPTPTPDQDEKFNFVNFTSNSTKNPCKAFLFAAFVNITIGDAEKISLPRAYIRNTDGSTCEPQKSLT